MSKHVYTWVLALAVSATLAYAQAPSQTPGYPQASPGQAPTTPSTFPQTSDPTQTNKNPDQTKDETQQPARTEPAKPEKAEARVDDATLERQVKEQLSTDSSMSNVVVKVENGKVTLTGSVANKDDRKKAKEMAKAVPGVHKVETKLEVAPSTGASASSKAPGSTDAHATADTQKSTAGATAGSATSANAGEGRADTMGSVPSGSQSAAPSSANPSTSSQSGMGQTPSSASGATAAGSAAQAQSQIQGALMQQTNLSGVTVAAASDSSNNIQLSGTVSSEADRDQATRIAQSVAPNINIVDNIKVTGSPSGSSSGAIAGAGSTGAPGLPQTDQPPAGQTSGSQASGSQAGTQSGAQQSTTGGLAAGGQTVGGDLQSQIQTAIKNESTLATSNINVNVTDSEIELTGAVSTGKEKQTAKRIAQSYAGNRKVVDHITVTGKGKDSSDSMTPPK